MEKGMTYNNLIRIIHDKAPSYISFLIMLKFHFTNNCVFHILSFFLRFVGILILCANFSLKLIEMNNKSLSFYLRYLTSLTLVRICGVNNMAYIIISLIIFALFCFRMISYIFIIKNLKKHKYMSKISLIYYRIINVFEHLVYLLYPFIIEFLVLIFFSYIFPDDFYFKRDCSSIINILVAIINLILIIGYNINNYFFMKIINKPYDDRNFGIKYRYSSRKFWIVFLLQDVSLIQNIQLFFRDENQLKIFSYVYLCFFCLIFLILFLISLQKYNYQNIFNTLRKLSILKFL